MVFDGQTDASTGLACHDCHTASALFQTRKQALISMTDHGEPKACFVCRNDQKAFNDCQKRPRKH